jgi:aspartate 4-decarboxylase
MANTNVSTGGGYERLHQLSPFELKDELIRLAKDDSQGKARTDKMLNAGRGNPNWVATTPREAFFLLGQFALSESKRVWDEPDFGGMPRAPGAAQRLLRFLGQTPDSHGSRLLRRALDYGINQLGFEADRFVHELTDSIVGDDYPVPDRMLRHAEAVVHRYLQREMCDDRPPPGRFDLFATEGGTAAMCYLFSSLMENHILHQGDTIALGTPIFTPYIEIPHLNNFELRTVTVEQSEIADGRHVWQYPDAELDKLADPRIKAFLLVNPSNPASFAMRGESIDRLVDLVETRRRDLLLITDDVYGTFVPHFRSLAADLPRNTLLVYSFSKYFGCTGWRLGVVALHEDNVLDEMIRRLPQRDQETLARRYGSLTADSRTMKFIDRMVADSRAVALNHTAGLSLPQQVQMTLFSLFSLLDQDDRYKKRCREIIHSRLRTLARALGVDYPEDDLRAGYYVDLDLGLWGRQNVGQEFAEYMKHHHDPLEIVLELARKYGTVLLNGSGFDGPPWSVRVSLANLETEDYAEIGERLEDVISSAIANWKDHRGNGSGNGNGNGRGPKGEG